MTWVGAFRAAIVLGLAAHVFIMYGLARCMAETFGFRPITTLVATGFSLLMLVPFAWAVGFADAPEMWARVRAGRRHRRGQCAGCGYAVGPSAARRCPECGEAIAAPPGWDLGWPAVRRYLLMNVLALTLGVGASEAWILRDEAAFRREVLAGQAAGPQPMDRPRAWPNGTGHLIYRPGAGFSSND